MGFGAKGIIATGLVTSIFVYYWEIRLPQRVMYPLQASRSKGVN